MRYKNRKFTRSIFAVVILIGFTQIYTNTQSFDTVIVFAVLGMFLIWALPYLVILGWRLARMIHFFFRKLYLSRTKYSHVPRSEVQNLTWQEFEYYVCDWLKRNGYSGIRLTEKFDLGIDIIAKKNGITWGVQVKHYSGIVGINAVRQVVVALKYYKCVRAMVVTNSKYSRSTTTLAKSHGCKLIAGL